MQSVLENSVRMLCDALRGLNRITGDFPGGPVVKIPFFNSGGTGLIPGQGTKIAYAMQHNQKISK